MSPTGTLDWENLIKVWPLAMAGKHMRHIPKLPVSNNWNFHLTSLNFWSWPFWTPMKDQCLWVHQFFDWKVTGVWGRHMGGWHIVCGSRDPSLGNWMQSCSTRNSWKNMGKTGTPTQRTQKVPEEFIEKSSTLGPGSPLHAIEFPVLYYRLGVY